MYIKLALFVLFLLWVIKAPSSYRDSIRDKVLNSDPKVILKDEDSKAVATLVKACQLYKVGDPRRAQASADLASIRAQQLNFADAEKLYTAALYEHGIRPGFDESLTRLMIDYASVLTEQQKLDQASSYYSKILAHDTTYLDKTDIRIARDYNNLGLNSYLEALSTDRGPERTDLLKEADYRYKQALQIYRTHPKMERAIAVVLYNDHLALRDLDDWSGARLAKAESDKIESKLGRIIKAP